MTWQETAEAVEAIDVQIFALRQRREDLLMGDEEYGIYLNEHADRGEGEPLSIRAYYRYVEQLSKINNEMMADRKDFDFLWKKHRKEIERLERLILA